MKSVHFLRILLLFVFVFSFFGAARAVNFTVNNNADTSDVAAGNGICADAAGNCTLRAAVQEANARAGDDTIDFAASLTGATIALTTGVEIPINGSGGTLQITGLGADKLTIDGGAGSNRIFSTNAATVTITGVTLQRGGSVQGGAILTTDGTLVLNTVLVQNNNVGDRGGGIYLNRGANHRILNSTISNNSTVTAGGGLYLFNGTLFVANTTISGNRVISPNGQGGGVFLDNGAATFRNSTITNNTSSGLIGGIEVAGSSFNMGNTIIAGNTARDFPEIGNFNTTTSAGNNFIGDSAGDSTNTINPITYQPSDIRDQNPLLGILQNNGGPTLTHALMTGSPAINAGDNAKAVNPFDNSALATDQRGAGFPRIVGSAVDIGAFEGQAPPTAASVSVGGRVLSGRRRGISRVVIIMTDMKGETRRTTSNPFGYYRFDDVAAGETYILNAYSKRYSFAPQVVSITEEFNELNFTSEP